MQYLKRIARKFQKLLETKVLSNLLSKTIWRYRHIYKPSWANISINSQQFKHRYKFVDTIASFQETKKILEIGCAAGPNLRLLRENLPKTELTGIDINKKCVDIGNKYFQSKSDYNCKLFNKSTDQLSFFKDKSFDVVCSQAVFIFLPPDKIEKAIFDITRLSRKGLVLHEYYKKEANKGYFDEGCWVYDYPAILNKFLDNPKIQISSSSFKGGSWDTFGRIIKVSF